VHLGLIGGIGPAATEFYYRGLVRAHVSANRTMELTIVHADVRELLANMTANAPDLQAKAFLRLALRLQAAGAEVMAVTSMAGHFCIRELQALSPLPIINAIPEVEAELVRRGLRCVGLLGTRVVMESRLYGGIPGIRVVVPKGADLDSTHSEYVAIATSGRATDRQREFFLSTGLDLCRRQGAEAVVLAGTDLFLAFDGHESSFPVIDSAQVHIDALYRESIKPSAPDPR
jgi:aspartate racemase